MNDASVLIYNNMIFITTSLLNDVDVVQVDPLYCSQVPSYHSAYPRHVLEPALIYAVFDTTSYTVLLIPHVADTVGSTLDDETQERQHLSSKARVECILNSAGSDERFRKVSIVQV